MKTKTNSASLKSIFLFLIIPLFFFQCTTTQKGNRIGSTEIKNFVDSSKFIFVAERVNPLRGGSRHLTSRYDVVVKKDTINSNLPFFGRAFQAPFDPTKGGIQFISHDFTYNITSKKEEEWSILIKLKDVNDVQQLIFNIFNNGTATLNVVNTHRDPISFYGYIEKIKK